MRAATRDATSRRWSQSSHGSTNWACLYAQLRQQQRFLDQDADVGVGQRGVVGKQLVRVNRIVPGNHVPG